MDFTQDQSIEIYDVVQGYELLRIRDKPLSSRFTEAEKFEIVTKDKWKIAYRCRVYLQSIPVAGIPHEMVRQLKYISGKGTEKAVDQEM